MQTSPKIINPLSDCGLFLLLKGRVVLNSTLRYSLYNSLSPANANLPLISCLMVTKNRFRQAQCAIDCFQKQTYPIKELVIVDDGEDNSLEHYIQQLQDDSIRYVRLKPENKTLGELRNLAVECASGSYVCWWDDDDLADLARLELQMAALRVLEADACCLQRCLLWYPYEHRLAISRSRVWENSLLCSKAVLPSDPIQHRGEDTVAVGNILHNCRVALLDRPQLYTYVIHSQNTFDTEHFERLWQQASQQFEKDDSYWTMVEELAQRVPLVTYMQALNHLQPLVPPIGKNLSSEFDFLFTCQAEKEESVGAKPQATKGVLEKTTLNSSFGVNVVGHVNTDFGLGEAVRCTIKAIDAVGIPFVINNLHLEATIPDTTYTSFHKDNPYPINIIHTNPDLLSWSLNDNITFKNRYNIGYWAWETLTPPPEWQPYFDLFNEIWTPSNFSSAAISQVSPIPVIPIPHSIYLPQPTVGREALGLPKDKFIFLFIFDPGSLYKRKNPEAIIEAFKQAFSPCNEDVLLVLKSKNLGSETKEQLQTLAESYPILLIDEHFTREQVNGLLSSCDCYVSLHRAEGFGLTLAEAMFYGKPTIATGYSSNTDFMTLKNSFLVGYEPITLTEDLEPYKKGTVWADPDIARAAHLMRYVFENYEQAKLVGARAADDIKSLFSPEAVGRKIQHRIQHISKRF